MNIENVSSVCLVSCQITDRTKWSTDGQTVAGGQEQGDTLNQLYSPFGLDVDDDGSLFIADTDNHRIVQWQPNASQGDIIAGGEGPGDRIDQSSEPTAVVIDRINRSLIISEGGIRRVIRWRLGGGESEEIISNVDSSGLAMDDEGSLYVSDCERNEVRRYGREDRRQGVVVAGGHGRGAALNQLDDPQQIFVDTEHSVYVADAGNHRVMKWRRDTSEGIVVAGDQGRGNSLRQLNSPSGIFVDRMGSVYVVDQGNHRVMRWVRGAQEGEVLLGGTGPGSNSNQLYYPASISLDNQGNLYVADAGNNRVQRFDNTDHH